MGLCIIRDARGQAVCYREGLLELWGVVACSGYIEGTPHCSN
jgi:hypothetical protein